MRVTGAILMAALAAAFFRVLVAVPLLAAVVVSGVALAWFLWALVAEVIGPWIERRRHPPVDPVLPNFPFDFEFCEVRRDPGAGYVKCTKEKGHAGDHEGSTLFLHWAP
jgi:hypothetical protein